MEGIESIGLNEPQDLIINQKSKEFLAETAKWAKFLAIMGFISIGIIILIAIFLSFFMDKLIGSSPEMAGIGMGFSALLPLIYIVMGAVYLYPILKLYHFAVNTKRALLQNNSDTIQVAFENQKSMFKYMGILMIVILGLYMLILITTLIGVAFISN
ncbi:MAG: DUF5362 family protein [Saprospiraceae bacterium]